MKRNVFKSLAAVLAIVMTVSGCEMNHEIDTSTPVSDSTDAAVTSVTLETQIISETEEITEIASEIESDSAEITTPVSTTSTTVSTTITTAISTTTPATTSTSRTTTAEPPAATQSDKEIVVPDIAEIDSRTIMRYEYGMKNFKNFVL